MMPIHRLVHPMVAWEKWEMCIRMSEITNCDLDVIKVHLSEHRSIRFASVRCLRLLLAAQSEPLLVRHHLNRCYRKAEPNRWSLWRPVSLFAATNRPATMIQHVIRGQIQTRTVTVTVTLVRMTTMTMMICVHWMWLCVIHWMPYDCVRVDRVD